MKTLTERVIAGDRLVIVTTTIEQADLEIDWSDIVAKCEIVPDEDYRSAPCKECDGWDHEFKRVGTWSDHWPQIKEAHNYVYSSGRREHGLIEFESSAGLPDWQYYHAQGCSKQVAKELEAQSLRRNLDTLKGWYSDGWQYVGVKCDFEHGGEEYHGSCWGIDDEDYARKEVVPDIARQVAAQLKKAGFAVAGEPDWKAEYLKNRRDSYKWKREQFIIKDLR